MASPISWTMASSRCWITDTVMRSGVMGLIYIGKTLAVYCRRPVPRSRAARALSILPKEVGLMSHTRRTFIKTAAAAGAAAGTLGFPMVSRGQQKKLTVWWNRGYYKGEEG